jgi:hypothetical protein
MRATTARWGTFRRSIYNSLPPVEDADIQRKASASFGLLLEEAAHILVNVAMEEMFGLYLVHGHFTLGQRERMVECFVARRRALVTKPLRFDQALSRRIVPSRWLLGNSGFVPLEFSTDEGARRAVEALSSKPVFFSDMAAAIRRHGLGKTIGIASVWRDSLVADEKEGYLEKNYGEARESVIRLCNKEELANDQYTSTVWTCRRVPVLGCMPSHRCEPTWGCMRTGMSHNKVIQGHRHESTGHNRFP